MITQLLKGLSDFKDPALYSKKALFIPVIGVLGLITPFDVLSQATSQTKPSQDATNQSTRERDRILLKRNPIASEYQTFGAPGEFFGATSDAEGVDFRGQFSLPEGKLNTATTQIEGNLNYQDVAKEVVPGGSLKLSRSVGKLSLQFHTQYNASKRTVDFYQARWLPVSVPELSDESVQVLGFPRYSRDTFDTTSINARWRADYRLRDDILLTYEGLATNYDDVAARNRLEFQNTVGELSDQVLGKDGSTITEANITNGRIRRYFHIMDTARDINRHRLGISLEQPEGSLEAGLYYSRWVNDRMWLPWNFVDTGINGSYQLNNRYLPDSLVSNADIYDVSNSIFSNYRPNKTVTTDTDYALLIDWDKQLTFANNEIWIGAGLAWRNKERDNENARAVYTAGTEAFSLAEITGNNHAEMIMNNSYLLATGMAIFAGERYFEANQSDQFSLNASQSFLESIQDVYTSEETVSSVYVNAYQQLDKWFWRAGLRFEQTKTATRGAVSGPPENDIHSQGDPITSIDLYGEIIEENFDSFDAAFVSGGNDYQHLLPSLEIRYAITPTLKLKMTYFELLMRPQYFDTVRYRRINPPTRTITEGSPDLAPTSIENWYTGLEYTYSENGQFYAGIYYNNVYDFFYDSRVNEDLDGIVYDVTRVENGKDGYIRGIQTYWSQKLPLAANLNAQVKLSYTYSDTEANLEDRTISMPERADHLVAINLTLNGALWQYSTQFSWQSEALDDVGADAAQDTIREDVIIWNQKVSVKLQDNLTANLTINNILDYPERSYQGEKSRVVNNLYSGTTARLSIAYRF